MNTIARLVSLTGLAVAVATLSACSITRKPDGTIEVRESQNPGQDGIYTKVNIGGRCYLSNGIWCIPCGGGKALTCEEVRRVLGDPPWTEPVSPTPTTPVNPGTPTTKPTGAEQQSVMSLEFSDDGLEDAMVVTTSLRGTKALEPSETMLWSVNALTKGLSAEETAIALDLDGWQPGVPHKTVFSVNSFDSEAQTVDFTYITAWGANAPMPGTYANGVTVEYYLLGGDLTDANRDAVAIRIAGPWDAVAEAAAGVGDFNGQISTEYGVFEISLSAGGGAVTWNGAQVWSR